MGLTTLQLNPSMDYQALIAALNQNFTALENRDRTIIIKDNTGTPRIIIGYLKDGF